MAKSERSKRLKHSERIDRISSLPEPLVSRILSLLPTKYAVATSLLSMRWKLVWTSITNLNFDVWHGLHTYSGVALDMKRKKFTQFVNMVLLLLNPPCIQNFHLTCHHKICDLFYLDLWICAAIRRTVQKLELLLVLAQPMELPLSNFYGKTLAVLKLYRDIHFNIAASASVCFPNLVTLHLSQITFTIASNCSVSFPSLKDLFRASVKYANEESVHKLFASCPVLDNLVIHRSYWDNVLSLIISIPSLRSLTSFFRCFYRHHEGRVYKLQIDTPALKYLHLEDYSMCEYFIAENLSSLVEARVKFDFDESITIDANTVLTISNLFEAISSVSANIAPVIRNVTQLELGRESCRDWSVVIKNLLESSVNLEHLIMNGSDRLGCHESWWIEPLRVPTCLLLRVTTIAFSGMNSECSDELELVRYFLKNAEVLELLTVDCFDCSDTEKINLMQKISMIPRGSRSCQVEFK